MVNSRGITAAVAILHASTSFAFVQIPQQHDVLSRRGELCAHDDDALPDIFRWTSQAAATASLALVLATAQPSIAVAPTASHTSNTAAQIHLNSLPPATISVQIDDLPLIGGILSGTYKKIDAAEEATIINPSSPPPVLIQSPADKVLAIKDATNGHLEFDIDGKIKGHVNVDVSSKAGVAAIRVESPLIPKLPFRNQASALIPPGASALKLASKSIPKEDDDHPTAAHISLNSLPPTAISVQIQDLPVLGKALSGVYTKVDDGDEDDESQSAVTIESPKDKVAAIKAIASDGHFEFDVDGILQTHLNVDVATDTVGSATIRVSSEKIPALPFQNAASF